MPNNFAILTMFQDNNGQKQSYMWSYTSYTLLLFRERLVTGLKVLICIAFSASIAVLNSKEVAFTLALWPGLYT